MAGEIKILCGKTLHDMVARTKITELFQKIASLEKNGVGKPGKDGVGIESVDQTTTSTTDGGINIVTVKKTDGSSSTFEVRNGSKGSKGDTGETGQQGPKGDTGATGEKGNTGAQGVRGTGIYKVTTAPSSYTTEAGGFTPAYRISLSTVKSQSGATEILVGDVLIYSYYLYPVGYVSSSYVYLGDRISIRGAKGATGETGPQGETGATGQQGPKGDTGSKGDTGVGIKSVIQTVTSMQDFGLNEIEVTLTDGTKSKFTVRNGSGNDFPVFDYAQEAGYTGTVEEFYRGLADSAGAIWHATMRPDVGNELLTASSLYDDGFGAYLGKVTLPTDMEKIIVKFDDVLYSCNIVQEANGVSFGNANIFSSSKPNTNEPFYIKSINGMFTAYLKDKSARPTISLYDFTMTYSKLPKGFLPDDISTGSGERTHWVENGIKEVLEEVTVSLNNGQGYLFSVVDVAVGDVCKVNWNGAEYVVTAKPLVYDGMDIVAIGNFAAVGGENTGEPFAIGILTAEQANMMNGVGVLIMALDGSSNVTFSISKEAEIVHKLDNKFIDADWLAKSYYVKETVFESESVSNYDALDGISASEIVVGKESIVNFDGVEYTCKNTKINTGNAQIGTLLSIGNLSLLSSLGISSFPNTSEPFLLVSINGSNELTAVFEDSESHSISLTTDILYHRKMPKEFMPSDFEIPTYTIPGILNQSNPSESDVETAQNVLRSGGNVLANYYGTTVKIINVDTDYKTICFCYGDDVVLLDYAFPVDDKKRVWILPKTPHKDNEGVMATTVPVVVYHGMNDSTRVKEGQVIVVENVDNDNYPTFKATDEPTFKSIILKSTTEGSTKKFRITVDDSGTISATEVTE